MLIIRRAQVEAMAKTALGRFERSTADQLRELFPSRFSGRSEAEAFVHAETEVGLDTGFETHEDLALWLGLRVAFGDALQDDEEFGWARVVIDDDDLSGPAKSAILRRELLALRTGLIRRWEEATAWLLSLDR